MPSSLADERPAPATSIDSMLRAASDRYAPLGRWRAGFARGKLLGDPVYAETARRIKPGGTLIDIGCGEGLMLVLVRQIDPDRPLVGIDHDPRRLEIARRALGDDAGVDLRLGDVLTARLAPARYIVCLDVLHYEPPPRQDRLLRVLASALEEGGCLLIRDVVLERGWRTLATLACEWAALGVGRHRGRGIYVRAAAEIESAMKAASLVVESAACRRGTPFSNTLFVGRKLRGGA